MVTKARVSQVLSTLILPGQSSPLGDSSLVRSVDLAGETVRVTLLFPELNYGAREAAEAAIRDAVLQLEGATVVEISWQLPTPERRPSDNDPVPQARNVILVMSGKGGVGKSTVATNLALALSRMGTRVGLLDADIYGPSIPTMLGITGRPESDGQRIKPLSRFGIKLMSMGFLLDDPSTAVVWRGPMLHGALLQFLRDVDWGELDFLLLDLPPGTGDVALTLSQNVNASGAVIVTTPQEVALQDVYKAVSMARKVGIEILGVVENQSYFVCNNCGEQHQLFGAGGGEKVSEMAHAPLLGQIPLDARIRQWGDAGTPLVQASPGSESSKIFNQIALGLVERAFAIAKDADQLTIDRSGGTNRHLPVTR